jgi:hypothetical protein
MQRITNTTLALLLVAGATLAAGCSSGPDPAATAEAMDRFNLETAKANDAIDQTVSALKALVQTPGDNLKGSYETFGKSLTALEGQAEVVRTRAQEMKERGEEFFKEWHEGSDTGLSAETQGKLNVSYAKIKEGMMGAKDAFTPFLASLKDVHTLLGLDLTEKGLQTAAPLVVKAQARAGDVKSRLTAVMDEVNSVRALLASKPAS